MIIRFLMILVAAIVAVLLLKVVAAIALVAVVAFGVLFTFNVARSALTRGGLRRRVRMRHGGPEPQPMRPVTPLARPNISVRR